MKYVKAQNVFPKSLLDEIQGYVQGDLVYIPKTSVNYKKWGAGTNSKMLIAQRNDKIKQNFRKGATITRLAETYNLSEDTIKKIVYCRNS